MNNHLR